MRLRHEDKQERGTTSQNSQKDTKYTKKSNDELAIRQDRMRLNTRSDKHQSILRRQVWGRVHQVRRPGRYRVSRRDGVRRIRLILRRWHGFPSSGEAPQGRDNEGDVIRELQRATGQESTLKKTLRSIVKG